MRIRADMSSARIDNLGGKTCESCNAQIIWAVTETGKRIPVDAEPVAGGDIELVEQRGSPLARVLGAASLFDTEDDGAARCTHLNHFDTCPAVERYGWP